MFVFSVVAVHGGLHAWSLSVLGVILGVCLILTLVVWRQPQSKTRLVFKVGRLLWQGPNKQEPIDQLHVAEALSVGLFCVFVDCVLCVCVLEGGLLGVLTEGQTHKSPLLIFCWVARCVCAFSATLKASLFSKLSPHRFHCCPFSQLLVCSSTSI